jgi:hypothetical protein
MKMLLKLGFSILLATFICSEFAFAQLATKRNQLNNHNVQGFCYSVEAGQKLSVRPSFDINELCSVIDFKTSDNSKETLVAEIHVKIDRQGNVVECFKNSKTLNDDANISQEWTEAVIKAIKQVKFTPAQTEKSTVKSTVTIVVRRDANGLCF